MAFSYEGHRMTAPLAHSVGEEETSGPEDPSLNLSLPDAIPS